MASALALTLLLTGAYAQNSEDFTDSFRIEDCTFINDAYHPLWSLVPGTQLAYAGIEDGEEIEQIITVLDETFTVIGVETRVVEERGIEDGELVEVSRNYFAICEETNDVYYFGEDVDDYENGEIVGHESAWLSGVDGATPGILVPGTALLGSRFFQEVAPGLAEDRVEVVSLSATVETPLGTFENALELFETTPLEPGVEDTKFFFPGVGLIKDGPLDLVSAVPEIDFEAIAGTGYNQVDPEFTDDFRIEECSFINVGRNAYFILEPGFQITLEGEEDGKPILKIVTVLDQTRLVDGVETRVVEEQEFEDGELIEVSRNFFAICQETSDVFYFGEDVDDYEDGEIVGHGGAWLAGVNGARPGILIPGTILLGAKYYQETDLEVALDRAENVALDSEVVTPYATFAETFETLETTPLEPGDESFKNYAPGIGLVFDDVIFLTELTEASTDLVDSGSGDLVGEDITHPDGNVYNQILLTGQSVTMRTDGSEISRVSFLDPNGDIVQVETSGNAVVTVTLDSDSFTDAAPPAKYNQPTVSYVGGLATVQVTGADSSTFISIFTVGSINAVNQALFPEGEEYDAMADIALLEITNSAGMGGILCANTRFNNSTGDVGLKAPGVPVAVRVLIGDIDASGDAVPNILFGEGSFTVAASNPGLRIAGGDLIQTNEADIVVAESGSTTPGFDTLISQNNVKSDGTEQATQSIDETFVNEDGDEITVTIDEETI